MKKNYLFTLCLTMTFLSFEISAQEDQYTADAVLMILEKESNLPVCRLSDQVRINSEFIPKNRIGDVEMASIEDIRVCEEEDVWNAVEEEVIVGMAVGTPNFAPVVLPMISGGVVGCFMGYMLQWGETIGTGTQTSNPLARFMFYVYMGIPSAIIGSFSALIVNVLRTGAPPKSTPISFYLKGLGVGVSSVIIVGEVCREYQWWDSAE